MNQYPVLNSIRKAPRHLQMYFQISQLGFQDKTKHKKPIHKVLSSKESTEIYKEQEDVLLSRSLEPCRHVGLC